MSVEKRMRAWAQLHRSSTEMTLFLLNIPRSSRKAEIMSWIDSCGFQDLYDFFYLPRVFATRECQGYAFINMMNVHTANRFKATMHGIEMAPGLKLKVQVSKVQGLEENMARWATARCLRVKDAEVMPFVRSFGEFDAGFRPGAFEVKHADDDGPSPDEDDVPLPNFWQSEASTEVPIREAGARTQQRPDGSPSQSQLPYRVESVLSLPAKISPAMAWLGEDPSADKSYEGQSSRQDARSSTLPVQFQ